MIGIELLLCYLLLFLAARADYLFRALALDPATVKPKSPFGIDIPMDSTSLSDPERISEWGRIWASISIGTYQGNLFCREYDRGQYSSMRLRKSELSVQQSMRLSRMIRRLRSSSASSGIGTERQ